MNAHWILSIAIATGLSANAQAHVQARMRECAVTVYVAADLVLPDGMLARAEGKATAIFRDIGVPLRWRSGAPPATLLADACGAPLIVRIESSEHAHVSAEALAYSTPFADSGTCIHVLLDRVRRGSSDFLAPVVLAYVLAHEITHVLERTTRHSKDGIMKAHWECSDYQRIEFGGLAFSLEDIDRIHLGIAERAVRQAAERNAFESKDTTK
jgi:hypothetical protein